MQSMLEEINPEARRQVADEPVRTGFIGIGVRNYCRTATSVYAAGDLGASVEALRNDMQMRLHGAPVERDKAGHERGRYQHPEYYGRPAQMGMDYRPSEGGPEPAHPSPVTSGDKAQQN